MKRLFLCIAAFIMVSSSFAQSEPYAEISMDTLSGCAPFTVEFRFKSVSNTDTLRLFPGDGYVYYFTCESEWNVPFRHEYEIPGRYIPVIDMKQWVTRKDSVGGEQNVKLWGKVESPDTIVVINCESGIRFKDSKEHAGIHVKVFPNPTTEQLQVHSSEEALRAVRIFNSLGQEVVKQELDGNAQIIDVSTLARGLYYLRIETERTAVMRKIVVE